MCLSRLLFCRRPSTRPEHKHREEAKPPAAISRQAMTYSFRLDGGETRAQDQNPRTASLPTPGRCTISIVRSASMSCACGVTREAIHQLWEGMTRCHDERRSRVRMTDRIRIARSRMARLHRSSENRALSRPYHLCIISRLKFNQSRWGKP